MEANTRNCSLRDRIVFKEIWERREGGGGDCSFKVPDSFQTSQSLHRAAEGPPSGRKSWKRNGVSHQTKCDKLVFGSYTHACTYLKMCLVASTHHRGTVGAFEPSNTAYNVWKINKDRGSIYLSIGMPSWPHTQASMCSVEKLGETC